MILKIKGDMMHLVKFVKALFPNNEKQEMDHISLTLENQEMIN
jgi:hypothetical protein